MCDSYYKFISTFEYDPLFISTVRYLARITVLSYELGFCFPFLEIVVIVIARL